MSKTVLTTRKACVIIYKNTHNEYFMDCRLKGEVLYKLFPSKEIVDLIFNEVFIKLSKHSISNKCFSDENINAERRKLNYKSAYETVETFLTYEAKYLYDKIKRLSNCDNIKLAVDTILMGYTLCLIPDTLEYDVIDLFIDKRSLFFSLNTVFDIN